MFAFSGRKGQLTVFMILGLIILLSIGLLLMYSSMLRKGRISGQYMNSPTEKTGMMESYVESCLNMAAVKTLVRFGYQGGEFDFLNPMWFKTLNSHKLAYGLKFGYNLIPSKEEAQLRLQSQMDKEIQKCMDFGTFENYGINVTGTDGVKTNILLGEKSTIISVDTPLVMSENGRRVSVISDFRKELHLELANVLILAFNLAEQIKDSSTPFDLSKLDLSCSRIMACYEGSGLLRIISYNSFGEEPFYIYQFAIDREILPACTSMENLNRGVCR